MRHLNLTAYIGIALLIAVPDAGAGIVVYEQLPGPDSQTEFISSPLPLTGGPPGFRTADDFVLATDTIITGVNWWGNPPLTNTGGNDFQFTFYANGGGVPGAILQTSGGTLSITPVSIPGTTFSALNFYSSDLFSPFSATAGTTYWISIFNQATDARWLWLMAENVGNGGRQGVNPGPPWPFSIPNLAFQLTSVPEPSSLVLLGFGTLGLAGYCWRYRRRRPVP